MSKHVWQVQNCNGNHRRASVTQLAEVGNAASK